MMATAVPSRRPGAVAIGEVLDGKYQIVRELGRGAMGVVYEALHLALERKVAVKTLLEEVSADPQIGARFEREARAASAIGHPHIVDVFDLGRTGNGLLFMVMELLDGESLGSMLKRTPKLPIPLAVHLMSQVLSGLGAAHKHGIVHRDLKPDNIFVLTSEERPNFVKIVDFGISKVIAPTGPGNPNVTAKVAGTMVGSVLGTPLYMSPEQAIGQVASIDHRTDIYSAGVVLYEMLCGRTPYLGDSYVQIFAALLEGNYPPPRSLAPEIPPELEAAIVRALDRDMDKRFPSVAAMRQAIGASADLTPAPVLMPVSIGEPLGAAAPQVPSIGKSSIALAPTPAPPPSARRPGPAHDPFAPPPDTNMAPILADDLERPVALRTPVRSEESGRAAVVSRPQRSPDVAAASGGKSPSKGTIAPERILSARARSRLLMVLAALGIAIAARVAYSVFRSDGQGSLSLRRPASPTVLLDLLPSDATVQLDHSPTSQRELVLQEGTEHVLNVAAPGRLTRRFSFVARPGLKVSIHLGHALPLPAPTDPAPLEAELAADSPENPHDAGEVENAFAKLDRYAECLSLSGDAASDGKKGNARSRMRAEEYGLCQRLTAEASAASPAMPELQAAADGYLAAVHGGQRMEQLARLGATFRAEYLAARAQWQMEELALQRKTPGQADWHARRVALAAQTWVRSLKAGQGAPQAATKLQEYQRAFLEHATQGGAPPSGQSDFLQAAADVAALAGRKPTELVALDAVRRLFSAFNALILP
jgi:serine/threonine-protein kinase